MPGTDIYRRTSSADSEELTVLVNRIVESGKDLTSDYEDWYRIGFICAEVKGMAGIEEFVRLSQMCPQKFDRRECVRKYESLCRSHRQGTIGLGTLVWIAREKGAM